MTAALGEAYIALCIEYLRRQQSGKPIPQTEMLDMLMTEFKRSYRRK